MHIPPIPPSSFSSQNNTPDPYVDEYQTLWDEWYDNPTQQTGEDLLHFLDNPKVYRDFEKLAKNYPFQPTPTVGFDQSYETAKSFLKNWISHGCDPDQRTPVSEFLTDVAKWVNYAGSGNP